MKTGLRNKLVLSVLPLMLALTLSDAQAQFGGPPGGGRSRGGFGGGGSAELLRNEAVQKELGLTPDQISKIEEAQRGMRDNPEIRDLFSKMREVSSEERGAIFAQVREIMERQTTSSISEDQKKRLGELVLQQQGMRALSDDSTAKSLGLSEDQQSQAKSIVDEYEEKRREVRFNRDLSDEDRDAQLEKLNTERDEKVGAILTAQQRSTFTQRQGRPFDFSGGSNPPTGPTPVTGAPVAGAAPAGPRPTAIETVVPEGAEATVSFGGGERAEGKPVEEMSFNFRYAPWEDVLKLFADASGLTLDLYAIPPGTFNYYDNGKYTPTQALDILNGYLIQKGFILVRRDEFLVVLNIDSGIPPNLVPTVDVADLPKRGRNELLRVVMPLPAGMTPEDAATEVQALLGPQGTAVPLSKTGRLVLTDIGSNLQRVNSLLSGLDIEDSEKVFRQFRLENINVLDADTVIRDLFGLGPRGVENVSASAGGSSRGGFDPRSFFSSRFGSSSSSSSRDSSRSSSGSSAASADPNAAVKVAIDERTNSLLVTASPQNMKIVEEAVTSIDIPEGNGVVNRTTREPYLEVYQLKSADAMEVTKTLNVLYPGTVVNEDGRARRIHIQATPEQHREISATIARLDGQGGGSQVAVIPLGRLDSYTATASIQQLFLLDGNDAPIIQPHPTGNGLIVRGTAEQVEQIKTLLTQLDPSQGGPFSGGNVRQIPLGGRDPEEFLKALQELWGTSARNPIRTVVPSAGSGTIKAQKIPSLQNEETEAAPRSSDRRDNPFRGGASLDTQRPETQGRLIAQQMGDEAVARIAVVLEDELAYQAVEEEDVTAAQPANSNATYDELTPAEQAELENALDAFLTASAGVEEADDQAAADDDASEEASDQSGDADKPAGDSPIAITVSGGNIVAVSDDTDALDAFEEAASRLSQAMPPKAQWTVFYLQSADATETSTILERLFPTSSVSSISSSSTGGFLGSLSSGLSSLGGGLMNMTGLDSVLTGPQTLRIIPDVRSNSLFVTGPPHQVAEVEDVLRILDASELPDQLSDRSPHYIAVRYAFVGDVAQMIQDVFKEELTPPQQAQQQQQRGGQNPLAALMGGGGSGGNTRGERLANRVKMTLAVDYQNSRLIVSASESLARNVEAMVAEVDEAAFTSRPTTRIVSLEHSSTAALQKTIGALMPRVKVTGGSSNGNNSNNNNGSSSPGGAPGGDPADQMRQMFMQRAMERAGGGPPGGGGSPFGGGDRGGSPFGGRGGSPFGGGGSPFGGRGGSPFGGRGGR